MAAGILDVDGRPLRRRWRGTPGGVKISINGNGVGLGGRQQCQGVAALPRDMVMNVGARHGKAHQKPQVQNGTHKMVRDAQDAGPRGGMGKGSAKSRANDVQGIACLEAQWHGDEAQYQQRGQGEMPTSVTGVHEPSRPPGYGTAVEPPGPSWTLFGDGVFPAVTPGPIFPKRARSGPPSWAGGKHFIAPSPTCSDQDDHPLDRVDISLVQGLPLLVGA